MCRYELPTDDPSYERYRLERMGNRRPRYATYELDRMPAGELRALASRVGVSNSGVGLERSELVKTIANSGRIEIIAAPAPVEYESLGTLRGMGVGKLRRSMEDAGVFFDPIDVVEKVGFSLTGRCVSSDPSTSVCISFYLLKCHVVRKGGHGADLCHVG